MREFFIGIKLAYQRVVRGWDDSVLYSIDYYLADMIPVWVRAMKENDLGVPGCMYEESDFRDEGDVSDEAHERASDKWGEILEKIADGFDQYEELDYYLPQDKEYEELNKKFEEGFDLFREFFGSLWG